MGANEEQVGGRHQRLDQPGRHDQRHAEPGQKRRTKARTKG